MKRYGGITGGQYGTSWETRIADNFLESYDTIPISIPASFPLKQFDYNVEEEIINPVADTVATATYMGQTLTGTSRQRISS